MSLSGDDVTGAVVCSVSEDTVVVVCTVVVVVVSGTEVIGASVCDGSVLFPKLLLPPYPVGSNGIQPKSSLYTSTHAWSEFS